MSAIKQAIEQLREEIEKKQSVLTRLEAIDAEITGEPAPQNGGGGKRVKTTAARVAATAKRKSPFPCKATCFDCDTEYTRTGARSKCPTCHPKAAS